MENKGRKIKLFREGDRVSSKKKDKFMNAKL